LRIGAEIASRRLPNKHTGASFLVNPLQSSCMDVLRIFVTPNRMAESSFRFIDILHFSPLRRFDQTRAKMIRSSDMKANLSEIGSISCNFRGK
jgi:hypothetical protein